MKISVITICFNSSKTIRRAIESVLKQKNIDLEYLLIDGASKDTTVEIIKEYAEKYPCIKWISEKDNGIYDAMNKGVAMASGDVIGILNSDDCYASDDILETVLETLKDEKLESCFGDILYVKTSENKMIPYRYWRSGKPRTFKFGWMPPHPAFFLKKSAYQKYGNFRLDCGTAADYELMLRYFEKNHISSKWVPKIFTYMEAGGASGASIVAYKKSHINDKDAWKKNGLKAAPGMIWFKKFRKLPQFILAKFIRIK